MKRSGLCMLLLCFAVLSSVEAQAAWGQMGDEDSKSPAILKARPVEVKIAEAMSAGPAEINKGATIAEMGPDSKMTTLRPGTNLWTCMPAQSDTLPPMCVDQASMQWMMDFRAHKPKPTNVVPGITYMLAGATQRSDSDPYDKTSPLIQIGPHWMIMWPFDPKATGLPTTHRATGSYIMWAGNPYAHVHVMGSPYGGQQD
jgi:hypothetical protein